MGSYDPFKSNLNGNAIGAQEASTSPGAFLIPSRRNRLEASVRYRLGSSRPMGRLEILANTTSQQFRNKNNPLVTRDSGPTVKYTRRCRIQLNKSSNNRATRLQPRESHQSRADALRAS